MRKRESGAEYREGERESFGKYTLEGKRKRQKTMYTPFSNAEGYEGIVDFKF